jgi:hypothetical protein
VILAVSLRLSPSSTENPARFEANYIALSVSLGERWVVERLFAWLQWFRRLVKRCEFHAENFLAMVRLGCMKIMLRFLWCVFIGPVLIAFAEVPQGIQAALSLSSETGSVDVLRQRYGS